MQSTISFLGGAGTVTGSNFLLDTGTHKLLVDCGLEQGPATWADNAAPFSFDVSAIDALIITHAHIDHIGRVPLLVRRGYRGPIISTEATKGLAEPMLRDALSLMRHDAAREEKEPLYGEDDIRAAMGQWRGIGYHEPQEFGDIMLELLNSGHILGSALAKFSRAGRSVVFTGDLGGGNSPLLPLCEVPTDATYLVMESVYGDRSRPDDENRLDQLEDVIEDTARRGGILLIPAFSTERTQDLLFDLRELITSKRVPDLPVFLDSPLAEEITRAYQEFPAYFTPALRARIEAGEKLFSFPGLSFVPSAEASAELVGRPGPRIVIAGSGMSNGGRVRAHEQAVLPDNKSTVLIVGYQAAGTLGRRLVEGEKKVRIGRQQVPVRCRVEGLYGYSAHMQGPQLFDFVNRIAVGPHGERGALEEVFVVMGEPAASAFLAQRVRDYLGVRATTPQAGGRAVIEL